MLRVPRDGNLTIREIPIEKETSAVMRNLTTSKERFKVDWLNRLCGLFSPGGVSTLNEKVVKESKEETKPVAQVKTPEAAPWTIEYIRKHFDARTDLLAISASAESKLSEVDRAWLSSQKQKKRVIEFDGDSLVNMAIIRANGYFYSSPPSYSKMGFY